MQRQALNLVVACALVSVAADRAALAAEPPSRIFRGLFGPDPDAPLTSHPMVELRVATYEARGRTVARAGDGLTDGPLQDGRFYSGITTGVSVRRKTRLATLNGIAGNALRLYPAIGVTTAEHSASGNLELRTSRRTLVRASAGLLRTPFHQILGLPIATEPGAAAAGDASVVTNASTTFAGGLGVAHQIGRRGLLTAAADGRTTRFSPALAAGTTMRQAAVSYTYDAGKGLAFRVGDGLRVLQAGTHPRVVAQDILLGIDVNRALTASRRTTVTFTTGSSVTSTETGRHLIATGSATLTHRIGRAWQTSATLDRGVQVADLLPKPFVGNNASVTVGGFLNRRVSARLRGAYGFGDFDLNGSSSPYRSYLADARAGIALGRRFQLYVEHLYYQHRFPDGLALPPGVPYRRVQHGTRVGLDIWTSLLGRS